jgi:hypothetical protein
MSELKSLMEIIDDLHAVSALVQSVKLAVGGLGDEEGKHINALNVLLDVTDEKPVDAVIALERKQKMEDADV